MTARRSQMFVDLERKIGAAVGETIDRELLIAAVVLPKSEVLALNTIIAVAISLQCCANSAGNAKDGSEEFVFDTVAEALCAMIRNGKAASLEQLAAAKAKRAREGAA